MSVAYSIGLSPRSNVADPNTMNYPGPGAYNTEKHFYKTSPQWKLGTSLRTSLAKQDHEIPGPGPGHYEPSIELTQYQTDPMYSMGKQLDHGSVLQSNLSENEGPGPGAYETNFSTLIATTSPKMCHSTRKLIINENPGPGQYDENYQIQQQTSLKYSFPQEKRFNGNIVGTNRIYNEKIGPGLYEIKSSFSPSSGFTIGSQLKTSESNQNPGPGAYESNNILRFKTSPAFKLGSSQRSISPKPDMNIPGPGQYSPDKIRFLRKDGGYPLITSSPRADFTKDLCQGSGNIGPGAYQIKKINEVKNVIILPQREIPMNQTLLNNPSPDRYDVNIDTVKSTAAKIKMPQSLRTQFQQNIDVPGPGAYLRDRSLTGLSSRFGQDEKLQIDRTHLFTPGPGAYDLKPMFAELPKYAMKSARSNFPPHEHS